MHSETRGIGDPPALLRSVDAANWLKISPRKLWQLSNTGQIPVVRIGRSVRYRFGDLLKFVDSAKGGA